MRTILSAVSGIIVFVLCLCLKYWLAKHLYSRDLGDRGIKKLFNEDQLRFKGEIKLRANI
jgi:hypothetical protein